MDSVESNSGEVTRLLHALRQGNDRVTDQLIPLVYRELKGLATYYMAHERTGHTLQATALVHEAYLRLIGQNAVDWQNRAHFLGIAAQLMRRILIDHAKGHARLKREGQKRRVPLNEDIAPVNLGQNPEELVALDDALTRLAAIDPRQSRVVELRYFGGLTVKETSEVLSISEKTVKRDWKVARAWLHGELHGHDDA
jgi:RNA polymerase sigma-70 factor (ECF subfamily)